MKRKYLILLGVIAASSLASCSKKNEDSSILKKVSFTFNESASTCTVAGLKVEEDNAKLVIPSYVKRGKKDYKVTEISDNAFNNNKKLLSIELPDTVTSIGVESFARCTNLHSINLNYIESISRYAFDGATRLVNVKLSDNLNYLGKGAFKNCSALANITLPQNIKELRGETFSGDASLRFVSCSSLTKILEKDFYNCKLLSDVYFSQAESSQTVASDNDPYTKATKNYETNLTESKESSSYYFVYNIANKTCDLSGCIKDENTLKDLPTKVSYLGIDFSVTGIYDFAFYGSLLETIELPDTYSKIGQYAFSNSKIKNIDLKNITALNQYAFSECQNLTNIVLAESIVTYGMNTFYNDKNLTSVKILGKASSISQNMFKGCTNLNTIYISKDVSKIMTDAFADTALKTINFEGTKEEWENILSNSGDNISKYFNENIDLNINYSIAK